MRGAYGKAHGTVARVRVGQILLSVGSHDKFKAEVVEALGGASSSSLAGRRSSSARSLASPSGTATSTRRLGRAATSRPTALTCSTCPSMAPSPSGARPRWNSLDFNPLKILGQSTLLK